MSEWCYSLSLSLPLSLSRTISQNVDQISENIFFERFRSTHLVLSIFFVETTQNLVTHEDESILREREGSGHVFESSKMTVSLKISEPRKKSSRDVLLSRTPLL